MENRLESLALQLRCPEGEAGIQLAHNMNMRNLTQMLHAFAHSNIQDNDNILELGYGNGGLLSYVLSLADNVKYTGLEVSSTMHEQAISFNAPYIGANMAQYRLFDGTTLPFKDAEFDKIVTVNTIYFWQSPLELLKNICRVLKVNGNFCLTFADKSFMQDLPFIKYGFKLYDTEDIKSLMSTIPQLKLIDEAHKTDKVISKAEALVERKFTTLIYQKVRV
ncbi:class I SAM-dependent methyltransferase [Orbaceae bacterium ac157xtp]